MTEVNKYWWDVSGIIQSIHEFLLSVMPTGLVYITELIIIGIVFLTFYAMIGLILVLAERKVAAYFQQRLGPNRVGPWGILQTIADLLKLMVKELLNVKRADKFLYHIAPFIVIIASFMAIAAIPFGYNLHAIDFDIGIFYVLAVSSVGVLGILLAGWSSNNKYSLIGAMRSGAQVVSYELSVGLSLLTIVVFTGSLQLSTIVQSQADGWWLFKGHIPAVIAFIIFLIASTAETNRGPFDLAEAESELTAGFHTEYSGIQFAFFFLAEFMNMFIVSSIAATVFLGGWMPLHIGNLEWFNNAMNQIPPFVWYMSKTAFIIWVIMWFKWTFPRLRIDQLLTLEWKYLLPISLVNIVLVALIVLLGWHF